MIATNAVRRGWLALGILCAFGLASLVGCGIKRVPVAGTVTVDGQPIDGLFLVFTPDASKGNTSRISCKSQIKEGRYNLETHGITRSDSGSGVPPGWYKVSLLNLELGGKKHQQAPVRVNPKYMSADKTPVSVEVKDNPEPGSYDFKMTK
jgi:hypothetical protein